MIRVVAVLAVAGCLSACAGTLPASVSGGECRVIRDPGRAVLGKTRQDQQDIDGKWLEPAYAACGWPRPTH